MMLIGNPFTSEINEISDFDFKVTSHYTTPSIEDISKAINEETSFKISYLDPNDELSFLIYEIEDYDNKILSVYSDEYDDIQIAEMMGDIFSVNIDSLQTNENIHPLPPLTTSNNGDVFIFGTDESGTEILNYIIFTLKNTFYLILYTLFSFLLFGLLFGIIIGYYKSSHLAQIVILLLKTIEAVPLILWVLMTSVLANSSIADFQTELNFTYFMFGFFASTALSNLISEKINTLRDEDFIVALKLLGLSDYKIIFNHILTYFCLDIILLQCMNIVAQTLFLNITFCIIEFTQEDTVGMIFYDAFIDRSPFLTIISIIIFLIVSSIFYTARFLKVRI
tara:strand:- start:1902 stop:2912 length:1011 start_codon:yes stop_codon:yes gene_type:complete